MRRLVSATRIEGLEGAERGLSHDEANEKRNQYGYNNILEVPPSGWRDVVRDTARDPMIWFLVGTSVLFAFLGDILEAAVLAAALIGSSGTIEHGRLGVGGRDRQANIRDLALHDLGPNDLKAIRLLARGAAGTPGANLRLSFAGDTPSELRKDAVPQGPKDLAVPIEARNGNTAQGVETGPLFWTFFEVCGVLVEIVDLLRDRTTVT